MSLESASSRSPNPGLSALALAALFPVLACLALSFMLRSFMAYSMHGSVVWGLQGALRDALPGALLAGLIHRFQPRGILGTALGVLLGLWVVFLLFLCVSDIIYFAQCDMRLDRSLIENMSWTSMKPAMTIPVLLAAACGLGVGLALGWGTWRLALKGLGLERAKWPHWIGSTLWVILILGGFFQWAAKVTASPRDAAALNVDETLGEGQVERVVGIAHSMWQVGPGWAKPQPMELSKEDRAWALDKGLETEPSLSAPAPPHQWHRVVVVAVESLAGAFLDPKNPRRPAGMTPFLDSLQAGSPHLEACYSAGVDTEQGQFSLMASRTDFEWGEHAYPGPTLFSLARSAGYDTCMMFGDTLHFRSHDTAYPASIHVGQVLGKESFAGRRPASDFCSWGGALCDRAVFEEALSYLKERGAKPTMLLLDTLDTHPPYYWQKPEESFPEAVRAYPGGLAKALNQLDDNLRAFFDSLRRQGLLDKGTLVVITADHFPAYGADSLAMSGATGHGTNLIPMIFVTGEGSSLRRFDAMRVSSQLDLAPTLAEILGLGKAEAFMGRSLYSKGPGRALGRERDILRFRSPGQPDQLVFCDNRGLPVSLSGPLARWYRWRLGGL